MHVSRGIDSVSVPAPGKFGTLLSRRSLFSGVLRRVPLLERFKPRRRLIVSERIVEVPFIWRYVFTLRPGASILEIGYVGSEFPMSLSAMGFHAVGVDIQDYPLVAPNFTFVKANAAKMEMFSDGYFDMVFSVSTLEHIGFAAYGAEEDESLEVAAAREMLRVVKRDGPLLITVPFGTAMATSWYRVYDSARLRTLFPNIAEMEVYKKPGRYGTWERVSIEEGEKATYSEPIGGYPTECVACLRVNSDRRKA